VYKFTKDGICENFQRGSRKRARKMLFKEDPSEVVSCGIKPTGWERMMLEFVSNLIYQTSYVRNINSAD
jgi:hypothetical protein